MGWLFTAIGASSAQRNHPLWAFTTPGSGSRPLPLAPISTAGFVFPVPHGCSGTAEQEPSHPGADQSPFAPSPPHIEQRRDLPSWAAELSPAVGSTARRPQNIPWPLSRCCHARARPGQLASSPVNGLCSAVPALGKIKRLAPVFFPVGSRSWDASEAGGCPALLASCPRVVPAWAGRARCLLPAWGRGVPRLRFTPHPPSADAASSALTPALLSPPRAESRS